MVHVATVPQKASSEFDFIVVGGGTAGCTVAGRLAENPKVTVLVIEAGPHNSNEIDMISTPAQAFELRGSKYDWGYKATMIDRPEYTRVEKPDTRGKALGGSSCGNYYTWVRGSKATIDDWAEYGGGTWNWENCKEYFEKPATYHDEDNLYPDVKDIGRNGPLHLAHAELVPELKPFRDALEQAWVSKGHNLSSDVYSGTQSGLFKCISTIYNGVRSNASVFLEGRDNVTVMPLTYAKHLNFEGDRAIGVTVMGPDGRDYTFSSKHETIVSLGVYESPKLLLLSGIGPEGQLNEHKIDVRVKSEHVGQNLLDHPILAHVFRLKDGYGLDSHILRPGLQRDAAVDAYQRAKEGPLSSGLLELVAFPRCDEQFKTSKQYVQYVEENGGVDPFGPVGQPHFEVDFVPMYSAPFQWHFPTPPEGDWLTVIVDLMRPLSRDGYVKLRSRDPLEQPEINRRFFSNALDLIALREGVRWVDDILRTGDGMKDIIGEDYPWAMPRNSDEAMIKMILERSQTGFHPCGTCRLSRDIDQGVVDSGLNVHGVKSLRVIDASIFPVIPDCRIQNDVYMVAEKGADMIKSDHPQLYGGNN
ncbi:glucose-methanol-choline oxidoreductase [Rhizodiscina lignyota]|uniref:Glucose-methanol-choline oxidoreductase n=1 Tax=Rhizodiscina lignyota TaxID=1504668 RepID=A0A9P4I962_9PEZI|nr:glucose-methanol-choline oxidoreductase [Rhizodiscina lignyota]